MSSVPIRSLGLADTQVLKLPSHGSPESLSLLLESGHPTLDENVLVFKFKKMMRRLTEDMIDQSTFVDEVWNAAGNALMVIIDLSSVSHLDQVIRGKLIAINKQLKKSGSLVGFCMQDNEREVFKKMGLDDPIYSVGFLIGKDVEEVKTLLLERQQPGSQPVIRRDQRDLRESLAHASYYTFYSTRDVISFLESTRYDGDIVTLKFQKTNLDSGSVNLDSFVSNLSDQVANNTEIILDLTNVSHISDEVIGKLIALRKELTGQRKTLWLCSLQGNVKESLCNKRLDKLFLIRDNENQIREELGIN